MSKKIKRNISLGNPGENLVMCKREHVHESCFCGQRYCRHGYCGHASWVRVIHSVLFTWYLGGDCSEVLAYPKRAKLLDTIRTCNKFCEKRETEKEQFAASPVQELYPTSAMSPLLAVKRKKPLHLVCKWQANQTDRPAHRPLSIAFNTKPEAPCLGTPRNTWIIKACQGYPWQAGMSQMLHRLPL